MSHTPGPWEFSHRKTWNGQYATEIYDKDGVTVATASWYPVAMPDGVTTTTSREANARLIAAAPDGLEFAKYVVRIMSSYRGSQTWHDEVLTKAEVFIAKAEGA